MRIGAISSRAPSGFRSHTHELLHDLPDFDPALADLVDLNILLWFSFTEIACARSRSERCSATGRMRACCGARPYSDEHE